MLEMGSLKLNRFDVVLKVGLFIVLFFLKKSSVFAQENTPNGQNWTKEWSFFPKTTPGKQHNWYFYWGYNRAKFRKSDLHLQGADYDFTVYDVVAHDRPSPFTFRRYFGITSITIPQYNYRIGRKIRQNWCLSIGADHMKYVVDQGQTANVSGVISEAISPKFAGQYLQKSTVLAEDFLRFEHSDGLSLMSVDLDYTIHLARYGQFTLNFSPGVGGVWVVCRTDVAVFDDRLNTKFHIAGYSAQTKANLEIDWKNRIFFQFGVKIGYVSLPDILIKTKDDPRRADQNIRFLEKIGVLGVRF
jgi:hypothetical protein